MSKAREQAKNLREIALEFAEDIERIANDRILKKQHMCDLLKIKARSVRRFVKRALDEQGA